MELEPATNYGNIFNWLVIVLTGVVAWIGKKLYADKADRTEIKAIHERLDSLHVDVHEIKHDLIELKVGVAVIKEKTSGN